MSWYKLIKCNFLNNDDTIQNLLVALEIMILDHCLFFVWFLSHLSPKLIINNRLKEYAWLNGWLKAHCTWWTTFNKRYIGRDWWPVSSYQTSAKIFNNPYSTYLNNLIFKNFDAKLKKSCLPLEFFPCEYVLEIINAQLGKQNLYILHAHFFPTA